MEANFIEDIDEIVTTSPTYENMHRLNKNNFNSLMQVREERESPTQEDFY